MLPHELVQVFILDSSSLSCNFNYDNIQPWFYGNYTYIISTSDEFISKISLGNSTNKKLNLIDYFWLLKLITYQV